MSNSIMPSSERVADLLGESGRSATVLSDLLKNRLDNGENNHKNNKAGVPVQASKDSFSPSKTLQQTGYIEQSQTQYAYSNTMTLNLTTKEGDQISIDFRQLYAEYQAYEKQQGYESGPQGARYFESTQAMESTAFEERFGFSVKGDLNQDELKAIQEVFKQVDDLANHFFHGNIEQAFKKAVDLNVDFGQLQSVDLNLQQTQTYSASYQKAAAYQTQTAQAATPQEASNANTDTSVPTLPAYLQKMQTLVDTLDSQFKDARKVAEQMLANVVASRFPEEGTQSIILQRLQSLHDALVNKVPLNETTLKPSGVVISSIMEPNEGEEPEKASDSEAQASENIV